jgi:hypothetical protein
MSDTAKLIKRLENKANAGWKILPTSSETGNVPVHDLETNTNNFGRLRRPSTTVD